MRGADDPIPQISAAARRAARARNWTAAKAGAAEILRRDRQSPEGWFLSGLAAKAAGKSKQAVEEFSRALRLDAARYDVAIEMAEVLWSILRHREARNLLEEYESRLSNSPLYLFMAAETWSRLGLHARAYPLYRKAHQLQLGAETLQAGLAACAVLLGRVEEAKALYLDLLRRHPRHQRNHYELSRLETAPDRAHIDQMKRALEETRLPPDKNIFLYYAIAKELEDLGEWAESFQYYKLGGDAAAGVAREAGYEVGQDIALIDRIIEVCNPTWLAEPPAAESGEGAGRIPIFIVGLPRTGTTLTERIVASHSEVESADETFFLQIGIKRSSGIKSEDVTPRTIVAAAAEDLSRIRRAYLEAVDYRLGDRPMFIDKYPFNFLYLGFIARAFPEAHIVHLRRNAMDACFAMYKQSFFRFSYTLEDLADYYMAYDRLSRHWHEHLGPRIVEVGYESLVADPEAQIRSLLTRLGLEFEQACLDFHLNTAPSASASTVQVRESVHTRSVAKWKNFEKHLQPLKARLEAAGIETG